MGDLALYTNDMLIENLALYKPNFTAYYFSVGPIGSIRLYSVMKKQLSSQCSECGLTLEPTNDLHIKLVKNKNDQRNIYFVGTEQFITPSSSPTQPNINALFYWRGIQNNAAALRIIINNINNIHLLLTSSPELLSHPSIHQNREGVLKVLEHYYGVAAFAPHSVSIRDQDIPNYLTCFNQDYIDIETMKMSNKNFDNNDILGFNP